MQMIIEQHMVFILKETHSFTLETLLFLWCILELSLLHQIHGTPALYIDFTEEKSYPLFIKQKERGQRIIWITNSIILLLHIKYHSIIAVIFYTEYILILIILIYNILYKYIYTYMCKSLQTINLLINHPSLYLHL